MTHPRARRTDFTMRGVARCRSANCSSGKNTYNTKAQARSEAARIFAHPPIAKTNVFRGQLHPYKCPECRAWHLTSQPGFTSNGTRRA